MLLLKVKKLHSDAIIPTRAHNSDSGWDLYALDDYMLLPLTPVLIKTGISIELPEGYDAQIRPRSGLSLKTGFTVVNSPGTIDNGYRGEIGVIAMWLAPSVIGTDQIAEIQTPRGSSPIHVRKFELNENKLKINKGDRVAQLIISRVYANDIELEEVNDLSFTERGDGAFGSTGS